VGKAVGNGVPYFVDLAEWLPPLPKDLTLGGPAGDRLKTLGAGLAAYGAVAVYHIADYTPEALDAGGACCVPTPATGCRESRGSIPGNGCRSRPTQDRPGYDRLPPRQPHRNRAGGQALQGKRLRTRLWVTTGQITRERAAELGYVQAIELAGGEVVADTCAVVAPMRMMDVGRWRPMPARWPATRPMHSGVKMRFGDVDQCLDAAITGEWRN
jgi:predicted aconitase